MVKDRTTPHSLSRFFNWYVMYFLLLCLTVFLLVKAIYPAYTSPYSRLYSSPAGYPALLRKLGRKIPVEAVSASLRDMEKLISATGSIGYSQEVPISIEVAGIVTEVNVTLGQKVLAGDVLLKLSAGSSNPNIAALDVDLQRARKIKAEQDYAREQKAYSEGLISISDLNQFKTAFDESVINYNKAEELYRNSVLSRSGKINIANDEKEMDAKTGGKKKDSVEVLATTSGTVVQNDVQVGQNIIGAYNKALTIGNGLAFQAQFSQTYLNDLQPGQDAELYLRAYPNRTFHVKVDRVDRVVKKSTVGVGGNGVLPYVFNVSLKFEDEAAVENDVVSGMNGYVILRKSERLLAIPESAMMRYSGQQGMVLVVEPSTNTISARRVSFDVAENGWVGISEGLKPGEIVVKNGQVALQEHDNVEVKSLDAVDVIKPAALSIKSSNDKPAVKAP